MTLQHEVADNDFLDAVLVEVAVARKKFPAPNPTLAALTEEVGELAKEMLHIREGKHKAIHGSQEWDRVVKEAIQVAVMALRCATEGDETIGVTPPNRR